MRIGIEANRLVCSGRGIERHIRNLITGLANIDKENEYILFSDNLSAIEDLRLPNNFKVENTRKRFRMIRRNYVTLYGRLIFKDLDLFHFPNSDIWYSKYCKTLVTLHDLAPLHFPDKLFASRKQWDSFKRCLKYIKKNADYILTVSDYSKKDIATNLNFPIEKIIRIYNGVDERFCKVDNDNEKIESTKNKFNLPDKFILFVGGLDFRKNVTNLLKAFQLVITDINYKEYKLIIVGDMPRDASWVDNNLYINLPKIVQNLKIEKDVIFLKRIDDEDLVVLYNLAILFVFPSIFEGFGFPLLEAMACGCPVLCSNRCSLPEVVGEAGILFNPLDIKNLADLIKKVIGSQELRIDLSKKGIERAKLFSWNRFANETFAVYRKVAN